MFRKRSFSSSRGKKTDGNHAAIRDGLKRIPQMTVIDTTQTGGPLDLACYYKPRKRFRFIEIKDGSLPPSARKLTEKERKFIELLPDVCCVVNSLEEALREMGVVT
jgi:hypothetical protein